MYLDTGSKYVVIDGAIVETDALRIAEKIHQYDRNLNLICLSPDELSLTSAPFMVVCRKPDGSYYKVLESWTLDDRIIERLYASDQRKSNVMDTILNMEERQRKLAQDRYQERIGDGLDMGIAALKSEKSTFSFKNEEGDHVEMRDSSPLQVVKNRNKKSF